MRQVLNSHSLTSFFGLCLEVNKIKKAECHDTQNLYITNASALTSLANLNKHILKEHLTISAIVQFSC